MGLLAPLYALAALAIAGPIVFHLIQRRPQGQQQFSSLIFLRPSPPTLTKRSRIDHWLLLLLRALAIGLIAFAFARPFFRQASWLNIELAERNLAIVIDSSASMQRTDVWNAALEEARELLDAASERDRVALYTIDSQAHAIVPFDQQNSVDALTTQQTVRNSLSELKPTWQTSDITAGLTSVADQLNGALISGSLSAAEANEIVFITDLHRGCGIQALQGYPWPESLGLDVRQVSPSLPGNARPSLMLADEEGATTEANNSSTRIRIENTPDSPDQSFELAWANSRGLTSTPTRVQVPPGQVRVIPMRDAPPDSDRVVLQGDSWDGDNQVWIPQTTMRTQRIAFVGEAAAAPEEDPGFFLERAPLSSRWIRREIIRVAPQNLDGMMADPALSAIIVQPTRDSVRFAPKLREFASEGKIVLVVLSGKVDSNIGTPFLEQLFARDGFAIDEAEIENFSLVGRVDYQSSVFSPFADPRFNDFSKIRFWSHRNVALPDSDQLKVSAQFDNEYPLLVHEEVDRGHVWLLTTGWQPTSSGLALSSKFVPILMGIFDPERESYSKTSTFFVGEEIAAEDVSSILDESGNSVDETIAAINPTGVTINAPGLYKIEHGDSSTECAVQIAGSESQLEPLDTHIFEQFGIVMAKVETDDQRKEAARQMQVEELESKQRIWQWLIASCLVILLLETLLAGRAAQQATTQAAAT